MTILKSHILHPYEDHSLTFRDLKDMISKLGDGKSLECYEKYDGINLLMTWDINADELRVARNKSHIKQGGLGKILLDSQFADRPQLLECFSEAYDILSAAFKKLDFKTKTSIFGSMGGIWYSLEIINPKFSNTLQYENQVIIFHNKSNCIFDRSAEPLESGLEYPFSCLLRIIPSLNTEIEHLNWSIAAPNKIIIRPLDENNIKNYHRILDSLALQSGVPIHSSIQDFLYKRLMTEMERFPLIHKTIKSFVVKNILGMPGTVPMQQITSGLDKTIVDQINQMVVDIKNTIIQVMAPLEKVIYDFSTSALKDLKSCYVADAHEEISRLKKEVSRCINVLQSSTDKKEQTLLQRNIRKLQSVDNINTAMEGIVFNFKNKLFKLTGIFAPMNQICGHVKYKLETKQDQKKKINSDALSLIKAMKVG